jgi:hypothetical protein
VFFASASRVGKSARPALLSYRIYLSCHRQYFLPNVPQPSTSFPRERLAQSIGGAACSPNRVLWSSTRPLRGATAFVNHLRSSPSPWTGIRKQSREDDKDRRAHATSQGPDGAALRTCWDRRARIRVLWDYPAVLRG